VGTFRRLRPDARLETIGNTRSRPRNKITLIPACGTHRAPACCISGSRLPPRKIATLARLASGAPCTSRPRSVTFTEHPHFGSHRTVTTAPRSPCHPAAHGTLATAAVPADNRHGQAPASRWLATAWRSRIPHYLRLRLHGALIPSTSGDRLGDRCFWSCRQTSNTNGLA
jgi:hypothetical protein